MGESHWLATLHPIQRARVYEALAERLGHGHSRRKGEMSGFSVQLDRSVGIPHAIRLVHRTRVGRIDFSTEVDASLPVSSRSDIDSAWSEL